ncbi:MAG: hypothetical protein PHG87_00505 [Candidatus Omnitrophica bacterium]|nr:hypothetical protein [Candidatus Omnitrophota bacterium]
MRKKSFFSRVPSLITKSPAFPFLVILLIILAISILNKFPKGRIFCYSDFFQFVNFEGAINWFTNVFVNYGEGNLNFLYVPFYYSFLGFIQNIIGQKYMSVAYFFIFLGGSFLSFYIATIFFGLDKKTDKFTILCFSLLYSLNSYTAIRFELPCIYFLPYIFIPVLFATLHAYFMDVHLLNRNLLWCAVAMLISTVCWAGPPYFVAYTILTSIYIIFISIFDRRYNFAILGKKIFLYFFVFISSFAMYIFTWPAILLGYNAAVKAGRYQVNNLEWIYSQSLPMLDVFSFRSRFFGLVNINKVSFLFFIMLSFSLFLFLAVSFLSSRKNTYKRIIIIFGFMVLVIGFFLNKGKGFSWEAAAHSIFASNIILCSLRSFDKTLIFLPFMLLMPYCLYSANAKHKILPWVMLASTLIFCWPFINGNLYKKYYAVDQGKDYLTSRYASLVKIPQEYFDIASATNRLKSDFRILSVPWFLDNPDLKGWLISPKWKNMGANPLIQYFNHPFSQMSEPSAFRSWNYGVTWGEESSNDESFWIIPLSGLINAKYLIFQKDVSDKFVNQAAPKIASYKDKGAIKLLVSNPYFDFFEVSDAYFLPHFYVADKLYCVKNAKSIPSILKNVPLGEKAGILESNNESTNEQALNNREVVIEYKQINSAKYKVKFHGITKSFPFIFSESFDPFWRIYPKRYTEAEVRNIDTYQIFKGNEAFQASREEFGTYLKENWVSELGNGSVKNRRTTLWLSSNLLRSFEEQYRIDFISKKIKGTIQNDNISKGSFYDTYSLRAIDDKFHRIVNGYANFWQIDLGYLKNNFPEDLKNNSDGSYDLEVIIEFWPQKVLYISRVYVIIFSFIVLVLLAWSFIIKRKNFI